MSDTEYQKELSLALTAAKAAGEVVMKYFNSSYDVRDKGGNAGEDNPVTTADLASNKILGELLMNAFPDDGWLSEETEDSEERLLRSRRSCKSDSRSWSAVLQS